MHVIHACQHPASEPVYGYASSAMRALAHLRAQGYLGDAAVELCEGMHEHKHELVIGSEHTSSVGETVLRGSGYGAYLDSGAKVHGWAISNASHLSIPLWQAPIPDGVKSRQLWVNGLRAVRAHATLAQCNGGPIVPGLPCPKPLQGTLTATGYIVSNVSNFTKVPLAIWLSGAELVYGRGASGASWTEPRCSVVVPRPH